MIRAIETKYNGYRFRSRLEARWAVFFDSLRIEYEYEKEGYELPSGRYLPDFWLPYHPQTYQGTHYPGSGEWIEIKGCAPTERETQLAAELAKHTLHSVNLIVGSPKGEPEWHKFHNSGHYFRFDTRPDDSLGYDTLFCFLLEITDMYELSDLGWLDYKNALDTARGARFEFGEAPHAKR